MAIAVGGFSILRIPLLKTLNVVYRKVDALLPYARNPRTHSDAQVAKIAASIVEFGWTNPVLVDGDNGVIAGHGRLAGRAPAGAGGGRGRAALAPGLIETLAVTVGSPLFGVNTAATTAARLRPPSRPTW